MNVSRWELPADASSPSRARTVVHDELARTHPGPLCGDVVLLVSEVVTNAVVHARTPLRLVMHDQPDRVRVEVEDDSPAQPVVQPEIGTLTTASLESGRGLALLERLADAWGVDCRERGKAVWFEVADRGSSRESSRAEPVYVAG